MRGVFAASVFGDGTLVTRVQSAPVESPANQPRIPSGSGRSVSCSQRTCRLRGLMRGTRRDEGTSKVYIIPSKEYICVSFTMLPIFRSHEGMWGSISTLRLAFAIGVPNGQPSLTPRVFSRDRESKTKGYS